MTISCRNKNLVPAVYKPNHYRTKYSRSKLNFIMKRILLIMSIIFMAFGFSACSEDDEPQGGEGGSNSGVVNSSKIVGHWKAIKCKASGSETYLPSGMEEIRYPSGSYIEFRSNGEGTSNFSDFLTTYFTYKLSGKTLTMTFRHDGNSDSYTITRLTKSELIMSQIYSDEERYDYYFKR